MSPRWAEPPIEFISMPAPRFGGGLRVVVCCFARSVDVSRFRRHVRCLVQGGREGKRKRKSGPFWYVGFSCCLILSVSVSNLFEGFILFLFFEFLPHDNVSNHPVATKPHVGGNDGGGKASQSDRNCIRFGPFTSDDGAPRRSAPLCHCKGKQ